jgi:hypothetical protein
MDNGMVDEGQMLQPCTDVAPDGSRKLQEVTHAHDQFIYMTGIAYCRSRLRHETQQKIPRLLVFMLYQKLSICQTTDH